MARQQSRRNGSYEPGKSLRRKQESNSPENLRGAAAFMLACLTSRYGVYGKISETTGSFRLKIYDQDETFEDSLMRSEDWITLLGEFASQLGIEELYEAYEKTTRVRPAGPASEGREAAKPTSTLRGAPRGAEGDVEQG